MSRVRCDTRGVATTGFRMVIDDVFSITGRSFPIVVGRRSGDVSVGDQLNLIRQDGSSHSVYVRSVEFVCRPGTPPDPDATSLGVGDDLAADDLHAGDVLESA